MTFRNIKYTDKEGINYLESLIQVGKDESVEDS